MLKRENLQVLNQEIKYGVVDCFYISFEDTLAIVNIDGYFQYDEKDENAVKFLPSSTIRVVASDGADLFVVVAVTTNQVTGLKTPITRRCANIA